MNGLVQDFPAATIDYGGVHGGCASNPGASLDRRPETLNLFYQTASTFVNLRQCANRTILFPKLRAPQALPSGQLPSVRFGAEKPLERLEERGDEEQVGDRLRQKLVDPDGAEGDARLRSAGSIFSQRGASTRLKIDPCWRNARRPAPLGARDDFPTPGGDLVAAGECEARDVERRLSEVRFGLRGIERDAKT